MVRGYVLVHTEALRERAVAKAIQGLAEARSAQTVSGPYDVIAQVEAPTPVELRRIVTRTIEPIPGVVKVITCPVTSHQHLWEEILEPAYAGR